MGFVTKPKVLSLGYPAYAGDEFMEQFASICTIDVWDAFHISVRYRTLAGIAAKVRADGPYVGLIARMNTHSYEPIDEELLTPLLPHCKIIVSCSAGYNEFDVPFMSKNGVWFCNTRNAVSEPTADMTLLLILSVIRDAYRGEKHARSGAWRGTLPPTRDPTGLTLGIIGMGGIGKFVAKKAWAFNMKVVYHNRKPLAEADEAEYGAASYAASLETLLRQSDVVSVNCPLNAHTTGLIGKREFSQMKDGVFFVNTARGAVVDESALIHALESGKVARAGLDVFDGEPKINPYFLGSDRCVIQPHLGGLTDRAWREAEIESLENLRAYFENGAPIASVNQL
ncbi:glycerate-and formate-dehydrogenase [Moelleriella libera RCEF 2490]|uniref:Glycerate-and formate-dehydrogenase n=1 Tax=Moelleriella libera RCEF 2490 TaxID=1081109 RepID=A0A166PKW7_9HYPO|nr:glycerate-and formate-dehydrogenase [Moelleriella libera RCEF 2490]